MSSNKRRRTVRTPLTKSTKVTTIPGRGKLKHQRVIVAYHQLMQQRANAKTKDAARALDDEMEKLGGIATYQQSSVRGSKRLTG